MIKDADWQQRIGAPPERSRRRRRRRRSGCLTRFLAFVLVVAALTGWFWWQQNGLSSEEIEIASAPDGFAGYRIVLISDLHAKEFGAGNEKLIQYVKDLHPDLIAIVGDILHEKSQLAMIPAVASGLAGVAPTYYVTGNHEWAAHAVQELEPLLEENGVHVLSNTYVMLERGGDKIALLGAEDSNGYADQKTIAELSEEVRQEQGDVYKIRPRPRGTHPPAGDGRPHRAAPRIFPQLHGGSLRPALRPAGRLPRPGQPVSGFPALQPPGCAGGRVRIKLE